MQKSSKLEARLAQIDTFSWPDEEKARAKELAIYNAETWDSITNGLTTFPKGLSDGDYFPPRYPGHETTAGERAIREDAFDPS